MSVSKQTGHAQDLPTLSQQPGSVLMLSLAPKSTTKPVSANWQCYYSQLTLQIQSITIILYESNAYEKSVNFLHLTLTLNAVSLVPPLLFF